MICAANNTVHHYPMVVFPCLHITIPHYNHHIDLSESSEPLKCLSGTFCLECMSKIRSIPSIMFHAIYGAVHIQLAHLSYDDYENMCTLSYYHNGIGSRIHLPLFRVKSWSNGIRCMFLCSYSILQFLTPSIDISVMSDSTKFYLLISYPLVLE